MSNKKGREFFRTVGTGLNRTLTLVGEQIEAANQRAAQEARENLRTQIHRHHPMFAMALTDTDLDALIKVVDENRRALGSNILLSNGHLINCTEYCRDKHCLTCGERLWLASDVYCVRCR